MNISVIQTPRGPEASATLAGAFLYWGKPINAFSLALDRVRRIVSGVRIVIIALVLAVTFGSFFWYVVFKSGPEAVISGSLWQSTHPALLAFWIGVLVVLYAITRNIRSGFATKSVLRRAYAREGVVPTVAAASLGEMKRFARKDRHDIAKSFAPTALAALARAYRSAHAARHAEVGPAHLVLALLQETTIKVLLGRMGLHLDRIAEPLGRLLAKNPLHSDREETKLGEKCFETLFDAYHYSYTHRRERVTPVAMLVAAVRHDERVQEIFYSLEVDLIQLENVAAWMRITEQLRERYFRFRSAARLRPKGVMNRAMTAQATPELERVSQDLTTTAQRGGLPLIVDRERELAEIFRIFEGGGKSVVLVGHHGVGKDAIIEGIAERMIEEEVPAVLQDKRMVSLSISTLLAGVSPAEAQQRLLTVLMEIARAGNILLVANDIHQMVGVSLGEGSDLSDAFAGEVAKGYFLCIATTNEQDYTKLVEQNAIGRVLERVRVEEMDEQGAIQALEARVGGIEYEQKVFFSYAALAQAVKLADRYMKDRFLPEKAIEVAREAAQKVRAERGERQIVSGEDVATIVSDKTRIPVTQVTQEESSKLLNLEAEIHARVIGQDEAVKAISAALRRARAELREGNRPIANFLFLGPTGVGKTELAKTVAATYFGSEEQMVRLDMSEYQEKSSIDRVVGRPGEETGGILTEAVRKQPFTVLLLDELEKAHPDILNVFLQVMDDGRLTDNAGRTIDFTNVILIATSNAGGQVIQDEVRRGTPIADIKQKLVNESLRQFFKPEFLNRFDGVIVFKPLAQDEILQITWLMIGKIQKQLAAKGISFDVDDAAAEELAKAGYDPVFGARPLRRVIQERVQDALANFLLTQKIGRRDTVVLRAGGQLEVQKAKEL